MLKLTFDESNGGHSSYVTSLVNLQNGYLASGSYDYSVKIWNIRDGKLKYAFDKLNGGHFYYVVSLELL